MLKDSDISNVLHWHLDAEVLSLLPILNYYLNLFWLTSEQLF